MPGISLRIVSSTVLGIDVRTFKVTTYRREYMYRDIPGVRRDLKSIIGGNKEFGAYTERNVDKIGHNAAYINSHKIIGLMRVLLLMEMEV